jgi:hypothetical protein
MLAATRNATEYQNPVSLKNVKHPGGNLYRCVRCWIQLGIAALIQNLKGQRFPIFTGDDKRIPGYDLLDKVIGARFIILRIRDGLQSLASYPNHASKVETTFGIGIKYGLKYFAGDGINSRVCSLHFDGYEHYRRRIDLGRIRRRMEDLPMGIHFPADTIVDDRSSDHSRLGCQDYDDCQLLQLADVLVSGFRTALGPPSGDAQATICAPLSKLAADWRLGAARMKNSRWSRGYCIREAFLQDGHWQYSNITPEYKDNQTSLFASKDQ